MATLLLADHDNQSIKDTTARALSAAVALGSPVTVLVAGCFGFDNIGQKHHAACRSPS